MSEETLSANSPNTNLRKFAHLHQDAWRIMLRYPFYFIVLPAVLYFPFDYFSEWVVSKMATGFWQEMKMYYRFAQITEFLVGTLLLAFQLQVLKRIASREEFEFSTLMGNSFKLFPKLIKLEILATFQIGIRFLLLIVPGIIKSLKLALIFPVTIFENKWGSEALKQSEIMMKGHCRKIFGYGILGFFIYMLGYMGLSAFFPEKPAPIVGAIQSIPVGIITSLWTIGLCLFYADLTGNVEYARPVGIPSRERPEYDELGMDHSSKQSLTLALVISMILLISGVVYLFNQPYTDYELQVFGEKEHEIYYATDIEKGDIEKITGLCSQNEFFNDAPWFFVLDFYEDQYLLNIAVIQESWENQNLLHSLAQLELDLSTQGLNYPLEIILYDDSAGVSVPLSEKLSEQPII